MITSTLGRAEVALAIASLVYGGLLGAFALGVLVDRADQRSVISGMVLGIGTVTAIWITIPELVAWPWFVLIGSAITFAVGAALGRGDAAPAPATAPPAPSGSAASAPGPGASA